MMVVKREKKEKKNTDNDNANAKITNVYEPQISRSGKSVLLVINQWTTNEILFLLFFYCENGEDGEGKETKYAQMHTEKDIYIHI